MLTNQKCKSLKALKRQSESLSQSDCCIMSIQFNYILFTYVMLMTHISETCTGILLKNKLQGMSSNVRSDLMV